MAEDKKSEKRIEIHVCSMSELESMLVYNNGVSDLIALGKVEANNDDELIKQAEQLGANAVVGYRVVKYAFKDISNEIDFRSTVYGEAVKYKSKSR